MLVDTQLCQKSCYFYPPVSSDNGVCPCYLSILALYFFFFITMLWCTWTSDEGTADEISHQGCIFIKVLPHHVEFVFYRFHSHSRFHSACCNLCILYYKSIFVGCCRDYTREHYYSLLHRVYLRSTHKRKKHTRKLLSQLRWMIFKQLSFFFPPLLNSWLLPLVRWSNLKRVALFSEEGMSNNRIEQPLSRCNVRHSAPQTKASINKIQKDSSWIRLTSGLCW